MRYIVVLLLFCPMASEEPIYIGAGDSASQGYRFDLLQDVADQSHRMLPNTAHVLGLGCGSFCRIRSIQTFFLT